MQRFWECEKCGKVFPMVVDEEGEPADEQDDCPRCGGQDAVEVEF